MSLTASVVFKSGNLSSDIRYSKEISAITTEREVFKRFETNLTKVKAVAIQLKSENAQLNTTLAKTLSERDLNLQKIESLEKDLRELKVLHNNTFTANQKLEQLRLKTLRLEKELKHSENLRAKDQKKIALMEKALAAHSRPVKCSSGEIINATKTLNLPPACNAAGSISSNKCNLNDHIKLPPNCQIIGFTRDELGQINRIDLK